MLRKQGVDFLALFAPGVQRNMVRGRIKQIFVRRSYESRVVGIGAYLGCALSSMCYEDTDTQIGLFGRSHEACG